MSLLLHSSLFFKTEMRKKLAEQHRKAAYEALHGRPPPPPPPPANNSTAAARAAASADSGGRNVIRDRMEFNEYKCHSCFLFVASVR